MALTAFTSRLGRGQGRLATSKATGGDYAFVLGEDEPGRLFELGPGDHAEVTQSTDLTGVKLVRALLRLRVPASTPGARVGGLHRRRRHEARAHAREAGRERLVTDLAANVSKLSGVHTVGVRLELVTA
jgi:hypothetical protein